VLAYALEVLHSALLADAGLTCGGPVEPDFQARPLEVEVLARRCFVAPPWVVIFSARAAGLCHRTCHKIPGHRPWLVLFAYPWWCMHLSTGMCTAPVLEPFAFQTWTSRRSMRRWSVRPIGQAPFYATGRSGPRPMMIAVWCLHRRRNLLVRTSLVITASIRQWSLLATNDEFSALMFLVMDEPGAGFPARWGNSMLPAEGGSPKLRAGGSW